ncbi:MAG: hypothetical protein O3B87_01085 [bacterium]|nr:hypothetical protein [bacterium]
MNIVRNIIIILSLIVFVAIAPKSYAAGTNGSTSNTQVLIENSDVVITINNSYSDKDRYENLFFLGGDFTKVQIDSNSIIEKENFAVFDIDARAIHGWNPTINGQVNTILVDNNLLYVGGDFSQVNGIDKSYLAVFELPSGTLVKTDLVVNGPVQSATLQGGKVLISAQTSPNNTTLTEIITSSAIIASALGTDNELASDLIVRVEELGFKIPTLGDVLTFAIRAFFAVAGLTAMFYLLLGAFAWITSGGDKDSVATARGKIQAAVVGMILMVVVLGIVWTLEQVIFKQAICFGISCPVTLPSLIQEL